MTRSSDTSTDPLVGREIDGRYRIERQIGSGGMGAVYAARQSAMDRRVAIKVVHRHLVARETTVQRFLREAQLASRISHPNSVAIHDFGQCEDGLLYLVMEFLAGRTLSQVLRADGVFPPRRVLRVGLQLCDALEAAHRLGIVHRDLKPSNIVILDEPRGRDLLKVLDFGLAKSMAAEAEQVTDAGVVVGTPAYVAPEAYLEQELDPRSDLYALGVLLYSVSAGRLPFEKGGIKTMVTRALTQPADPLPEGVPQELAAVILRLLATKPEDRYPTASDARQALVAAAEALGPDSDPAFVAAVNPPSDGGADLGAGQLAAAETPNAAARAPSARRPAGRWLGLLAFLFACGVGAATVVWLGGRPESPGSDGPTLGPSSPSVEPVAVDPANAEAAADDAAVPAAEVQLTCVAVPNAEVFLAGERWGATPLERTLPRDTRPLHLTFARKGYRSVVRKVVPDRSQRIEVRLAKRPRPLDAPPF